MQHFANTVFPASSPKHVCFPNLPQPKGVPRGISQDYPKLLQLRGKISHQLHRLQLRQEVEALQNAGCKPSNTNRCNIVHKVVKLVKTYVPRTANLNDLIAEITGLLLPPQCAISRRIWAERRRQCAHVVRGVYGLFVGIQRPAFPKDAAACAILTTAGLNRRDQ